MIWVTLPLIHVPIMDEREYYNIKICGYPWDTHTFFGSKCKKKTLSNLWILLSQPAQYLNIS